eukprot:TRINITY_DN6520_c0_g1_i1.p1 TRINITY_DN6520_c0_g1~~TRINITY_DN6520_c0_g1_i1.p1  ORF type:complete len:190 (-),score=66.90 TRINITY_DN6520_c0_g1_i1:335-904(-)
MMALAEEERKESDNEKESEAEDLDPEEQQRREAWSGAEAVFCTLPGGGDGLQILGHDVMEDWESPYMSALAAVACSVGDANGQSKGGGRVLEVGFGMGISAKAIDEFLPAVKEHVILEANDMVLGRAAQWADDEAKVPTTVLGGFWQELVPSFEDGSFDGILFDAYPLSPGEAAGDGEVGAFFVEEVAG